MLLPWALKSHFNEVIDNDIACLMKIYCSSADAFAMSIAGGVEVQVIHCAFIRLRTDELLIPFRRRVVK